MVLYMVGLGLGDEYDITVKGLKAVQRCALVFLEAYTSVLAAPKEVLEEVYGRSIVVADRNMVESEAELIYLPAKVRRIHPILMTGRLLTDWTPPPFA
jgi:diphthine synthase